MNEEREQGRVVLKNYSGHIGPTLSPVWVTMLQLLCFGSVSPLVIERVNGGSPSTLLDFCTLGGFWVPR